MEISERAAQLSPSLTLSIDSKAKAMKAEGIDVCGFGAGEPDFDTPEHIKKAAIDALEAGFTKYTPSAGIPELRLAIAEKLAADNDLNYRASQVIVSNGAKHACYNAILATCCQCGIGSSAGSRADPEKRDERTARNPNRRFRSGHWRSDEDPSAPLPFFDG